MKNLWLQERMHSKLLTKFKKIRLNIFYKAGVDTKQRNTKQRNYKTPNTKQRNKKTAKNKMTIFTKQRTLQKTNLLKLMAN